MVFYQQEENCMILYIFIFLGSCLLLFFTGRWLVGALTRIAKYLGLREFCLAFILISLAAAVPNLFVGITSALRKIPQLSFGDVVGGNLIDLTLAVALATLFAKGLPAASKLVQTSAIFTMVIAILPLLLILDGQLGRLDGAFLISIFFFYIFWLFSKRERFTKVYDGKEAPPVKGFKVFVKDLGIVILGLLFLLIAAQGIVGSAKFFSESLNLSLVLVGILIVGLGNAVPETYFAILAARKAQNWLILGDLMGSVIVTASMVLGIVALIHPIEIVDFSPFAIARFFLIISAMFFFFFVRTNREISRKEALFLLSIYISFILVEVLAK
jgi:cation:H+ antiporter